MPKIGACYPCFKAEKAQTGVVIGKLVSANLTINFASGELYADDELSEKVNEFASGSIAMETDDLVDEVAEQIYDCKVNEGEVTYNTADNPPRGCLSYYKTLMRKGVKSYKGYYYPVVQAALGNDNAQTKGSSITFSTSSTSFTVFADDNGDWRKTKTFETAEEAKNWINTQCNITPKE